MESALQVLGIIGYVVVIIILCVVFVCFLITFIKKQREDKEDRKFDELLRDMMVQVYEKVEKLDTEEKTDIPKEPETKLEDMSIVELRKIAKDLNITYYYKRKKEDLIKAIKAKR